MGSLGTYSDADDDDDDNDDEADDDPKRGPKNSAKALVRIKVEALLKPLPNACSWTLLRICLNPCSYINPFKPYQKP